MWRGLTCILASLVAGILAQFPTVAQPANTNTQQVAKTFAKTVSKEYKANYLLHLPKSYGKDTSQKWPLMLFLHGAGERGSDVWMVAKHGPPKIVATNPNFPFIVVSPQCPAGQRWQDDLLLALLDEITSQYAVDPDRIYLTGLSMGGYGTWSLGMTHPEKFAAIVPICGGGDPLRITLAEADRLSQIRRLPVSVFHGAKDNVVPLEESQRMVNALKRVGNATVELTVYPTAEHDSWTATYANPKLYDWLLSHSLKNHK